MLTAGGGPRSESLGRKAEAPGRRGAAPWRRTAGRRWRGDDEPRGRSPALRSGHQPCGGVSRARPFGGSPKRSPLRSASEAPPRSASEGALSSARCQALLPGTVRPARLVPYTCLTASGFRQPAVTASGNGQQLVTASGFGQPLVTARSNCSLARCRRPCRRPSKTSITRFS